MRDRKYFINQLETLAKKYSFIKNIRGVGLMNAFDFSDDFEITKIPFIQRRLYDEGIFVQVKDTIKLIRFYPPLIINKEQIDYLISKLDSIFKYI
jgi:acetylornithine/succinyldiaminopimelate/putrescine aminotransferase